MRGWGWVCLSGVCLCTGVHFEPVNISCTEDSDGLVISGVAEKLAWVVMVMEAGMGNFTM